ncbi:iron-sulfur cluster biosynthesis family protein [Bacillus massilinigeriensis]|uniref:iron-sulfur cluster biosynthesis family protein n=1 Tax=Bacillus mediterraneensis TaxID=1805474 RepID=UPI0008F86AAF|nr:iron-sulfur cluster biosynthesis family protein [Bacillus mediterraneensis]
MEIIVTESAKSLLAERTKGKDGVFKLKYDTDDCGCAVNGVAVLLFVHCGKAGEDIPMETNGPAIYYEKAKEIFFDEVMVLDYVEKTGCLQLKSNSQYFNPCMSLIDMTKHH